MKPVPFALLLALLLPSSGGAVELPLWPEGVPHCPGDHFIHLLVSLPFTRKLFPTAIS